MKNFSKAVGSVSAKASCFLGILFLGKIKTHDYLHSIYTIRTMSVTIKAMLLSQGSLFCLYAYLLLRNHSDRCSYLTQKISNCLRYDSLASSRE